MNPVSNLLGEIGGAVKLFFKSIYCLRYLLWNLDKVMYQIAQIGSNTLPVSTLIALSSGAVIALQTGPALTPYGIQENLGVLVGIAVVKELSPIMASVLITGRVGSAMTAEIGSMSVYEEIDALNTMRIDPIRFLVMPRFLATVIAMPILVLYMDVVGWFGGALVAHVNPEIQLPMSVFYRNLADFMSFKAVFNGVIKSVLFGILISIICCYTGLNTKGGPRQIGASVTKAVVLSIVLVLVADYFATRMLLFINLG
ncbi:MAG: MlaE family ABC transporter permease [Thermodesulfobacteriota bacterium]